MLEIDDTIVFRAGCVTAEWSYLVDGADVFTRNIARTTCERALSPEEARIAAAVNDGFTIEPGTDGTLRLNGSRGPIGFVRVAKGETSRTGNLLSRPAHPWPKSLRGEWRVAGVDGKPFDAPVGVAIHVGQDRIEFDNCQQVAWAYRYDAPRIDIGRTAAITIDIRPKPLPCAAKFPSQIEAMVAAIDAADTVSKTAENGVLLSGDGRSVVLIRR